MLAKIAARNRFLPELLKVEKNYKIGPIGDRPGKVWLGSSEISNVWPSIVTGIENERNMNRCYYCKIRTAVRCSVCVTDNT